MRTRENSILPPRNTPGAVIGINKRKVLSTLLVAAAVLPGTEARSQGFNLAGASLEDLLNVEVTSVSKKEQTLSRTGASIFVIGQEDIRRSGAINIPDLLRIAPGVEVTQIESGGWAISIRGFNAVYANKVLVLVDGRTVYQSTFSGVFWDQLSMPLEDIDRIEVIRGPGGTVWGANAVNGVINIITKSAAETKGGLLVTGAGSAVRADMVLRYGASFGSSGAYRLFGRYSNLAGSRLPAETGYADGGGIADIGFRIDQDPSDRDAVTLEGGAHLSRLRTTDEVISASPLAQSLVHNPLTDTSGNLLGRWTRTTRSGSTVSLQVYDNILRRYEVGVDIADNTLDVELEHHFRAGARNDIVWGLDYRLNADRVTPQKGYALHYDSDFRSHDLFSAFLQDEFALSKKLFLTAGSKFEHNGFTGFEWEPGAQLVWATDDRNSIWASASRAIRQPDRTDFELNYNAAIVSVPGFGSSLVTLTGNPYVGAEHMLDFELGYRTQRNQRISIDLTGFVSYYRALETVETGAPALTLTGGLPRLVIPEYFDNLGHGRSLGIEAFANWNATRRWKLSPGVSFEKIKIGVDPGSTDRTLQWIEGNSPRYQPQVRSFLTLRRNLDLDGSLKYVSALGTQNVPGYARLDLRLGWRPTENTEISVAGQNLASASHFEFIDNSGFYVMTPVRPGVFCKVTWRF